MREEGGGVVRKNAYARTGVGQNRTVVYRVGGLVHKVMNLGVRTFWMLPNVKVDIKVDII